MNMIGLSWMVISGSLLLVVLAGVAAYWQVLLVRRLQPYRSVSRSWSSTWLHLTRKTMNSVSLVPVCGRKRLMLSSFSGRLNSLSKKLVACVPNIAINPLNWSRCRALQAPLALSMGVAVKGELNEVWVGRADLELNLISQMPAEQQA